MDLKDFIKNLEKAEHDFDRFCENYLNQKAIAIVNQAKKRTPVKTEALRASWINRRAKKSGSSYECTIQNGQNYATFIEYGTVRGIKPYNMITVPLQSYQRNEQKRFNQDITNYCKEKGIY